MHTHAGGTQYAAERQNGGMPHLMRGHVTMRAFAYLVLGVFLPKVFLRAWYVEASFLRMRVRQILGQQAIVRKFALLS
jgi:hypothetical protein